MAGLVLEIWDLIGWECSLMGANGRERLGRGEAREGERAEGRVEKLRFDRILSIMVATVWLFQE
jgi:hypothetical protein